MDQHTQNAAEKNPRWVPAISSETSASIGTHAATEAARVIFRFRLWPAALQLWHIAATDPRAKQWTKARWNDGQLVMPGLTCVVSAASFDGKAIRTVEGHAKNGELSALQKAFIDHFAFQCGYCTAGFLNEGQVLLERLAKTPVPRDDLEKTITDALDGHLCRCTGYIKYHKAVRDVILADPQRYLVANK
jgi:aerobic-type carbon monoxide dehydrogenase small subunit (CoxS/CutS family)